MKQHIVIDTSVFITYASYGKLYRLLDAVITYNLRVFVNMHLLSEFGKKLHKVSNKRNLNVSEEIKNIMEFAILVETTPLFQNSPDSKDNFLFDLALQTNSNLIITKEKELLGFADSPVTLQDIKWFKETYPVEL